MTYLLTTLALTCFAANSILCRLALSGGHIDAASFTFVRLVSGAVVLWALSSLRPAGGPARAQSVVSGLALFAYAAAFSFAYVRIHAGLGALVLFASVQTTMIGAGVLGGESMGAGVWLGLACALAGLGVLALPGAHASDLLGLAAMALAGVAWGIYSLRGRRVRVDPVRAAAASFGHSVPLAALLLAPFAASGAAQVTTRGVALACASGIVASGLGYSIWYAALRRLSVTRAAVLQLLVPVLAVGAGSLLLGEAVGLRIALGGTTILAGVALAIYGTLARASPQPIAARSDESHR